MKFGNGGLLSRVSLAAAALATVGAGLAVAPAAASATAGDGRAAAVAESLPTPWKLTWGGGAAGGVYTVTRPALGVTQTYSISGVVTSLINGTCYFVRATGGGFLPNHDSPPSCGPTDRKTFTLKVLTPTSATSATVRLCRGRPEAVLGCGPITTLRGVF